MESIEFYVEEDNEVGIIDAIIDKMDIGSLGLKVAKNNTTGRSAFDYKDLKPKYRAISDFRKDNIDALEELFNNFVLYYMEIRLYGKELIAIEVTKLEASFTNEFSDNVDNLIARVENNKNKYAQRKSIVEHHFGTIK